MAARYLILLPAIFFLFCKSNADTNWIGKKATMPIMFTKNEGQWPEEIRYGAVTTNRPVYITSRGIFIKPNSTLPSPFLETSLRNQRISLYTPYSNEYIYIEYIDVSPHSDVVGVEELTAKSNFYLGDDSMKWSEGVSNYRKIVHRNVWDGVDIEFEESKGSLFLKFVAANQLALEGILLRIYRDNGTPYMMRYDSLCALDVSPLHEFFHISSSISRESYAERRILETEFLSYFGGSSIESVAHHSKVFSTGKLFTDKNENIYLVGVTWSYDLPAVNAHQSSISDSMDLMLAKFSCDGKTLLYCTYLGGNGREYIYASVQSSDRTGRLHIGGLTTSRNFPTTRNALIPRYRDAAFNTFLLVVGGNGELETSTFIGGVQNTHIFNLTTDRLGNVYATGRVYDDTLSFITKGTVQDKLLNLSYGYGSDRYYLHAGFIAKLNSRCDTIKLATYLLAPDGNNVRSPIIYWVNQPPYWYPWPFTQQPNNFFIEVDSMEQPTIIGYTEEWFYDKIPVVNAIPAVRNGAVDVFITKLNSTFTSYEYSTYFGGPGIVFDSKSDAAGNIYIAGTASAGYPITINRRYGLSDAFITILDSQGKLVHSSLYGGTESDRIHSIDKDQCGNIIAFGYTNSRDIPFINAADTSFPVQGDGAFIYVYNPNKDTTLLSSYYNTDVYNGIWGIVASNTPSYLYLFGLAFYGSTVYRTYNAYQDTQKGESDYIFGRIKIPVCEPVRVLVHSSDTIKISRPRRIISPNTISLTVEVQNTVDQRQIVQGGQLHLPHGLVFQPQNQDSVINMFNLAPRERRIFNFTVSFDTLSGVSKLKDIVFIINYYAENQEQSCLKPQSLGKLNIPIIFIDDIEPKLSCKITTIDSLKVDPACTAYTGNPARITYTIRNNDTKPVTLKNVRLILPSGMGCTTQPAGDENRSGTVLQPNQEVIYEWEVYFSSRSIQRSISIIVEAKDDYNIVVNRCTKEITVPGIATIPCSMTGTTVVAYYPSTDSYQPGTVSITGSLTNPIDTTQGIVTSRLSLSRAPHLSLSPGDKEEKAPIMIAPGNRRQIIWQLKPSPVGKTELDTVVMIYKSELGQKHDSCEYVITIERRDAELRCTLTAIDSVHASGSVYQPFALMYSVTNVGQAPAAAKRAVLSMSSPEVTSTDSLSQPLSVVQPNQSQQLTWNLSANTSKYNRTVTLTVITEDSLGNELTRCEKTIFLPRISPALLCTLEAPDTIRYDLLSDTYSPNPFTASLTLQNLLDTAEVNIETEIDLTAAPHVALVQGEPSRKRINAIAAHSQQSVIYNLEIAQRANAPITERITIRYRAENDNAWQACEKVILIEGKERTLRASCSAYGPDSLFGDPAFERFIPEPAQFVYAITNTGTLPLAGCTATIIVPQDFTLTAGDATQSYGVIMPGQTVWREWSLVPVQNAPLTTHTVRWQWSCDSIQTNDCARDITLKAGAPIGFVLAPWKLRFEAEQGASLPSERTVLLWPGGGASLLWQSTNGTTWLDWSPRTDITNRRTELRVQPNTTAMPVGIYTDAIKITSPEPVRPPQIEVEYEIWKVLSAKNTPSPTGLELQSWPNPTSGMTNVEFRIPHGGFVRLVLHDVYGREVGVLSEGILSGGRHTIRNDVSRLAGGVYYYTLTTATGRMTKMMVVRR